MTSPTSYVLTRSTDRLSTFTAMNDKAEISEFDIRPCDKSMTIICTKSVITAACVLHPGVNSVSQPAAVHSIINYMLQNHRFYEEHMRPLRKSL